MRNRQGSPLSSMDHILSGDPVLAHVIVLFAQKATPGELTELPAAPKPSPDRFGRPREALSRPEVIGVVALVLVVVCALLGGLLDNAAVALGGLAALLLLGVGCHFAIKRRGRELAKAAN